MKSKDKGKTCVACSRAASATVVISPGRASYKRAEYKLCVRCARKALAYVKLEQRIAAAAAEMETNVGGGISRINKWTRAHGLWTKLLDKWQTMTSGPYWVSGDAADESSKRG